MNPLKANRNHSLSLASLLFVIISLVKSCEAQSDVALVAISIPTVIIAFFICALCWLTCAMRLMRETAPPDNQSARRSNLPIYAITPFAGYRRAYLLPPSRPPSNRPPPSTSRAPRPRPNPTSSVSQDHTKLAVHDPYDGMFVMEATLHQAEAPPGYEEAIKMATISDADQLEGESTVTVDS